MRISPTLRRKSFWDTVRRGGGDECWEWQGAKSRGGYGVLVVYAHRVAYELLVGPIPNGLVIRHRCDNPACVNPNHLEPGTDRDNIHDTIKRGRRRISPRRGTTNHNALFTPQQLVEVCRRLAQGEQQSAVARSFGCSKHAIWGIVHGLTYRDETAELGLVIHKPYRRIRKTIVEVYR